MPRFEQLGVSFEQARYTPYVADEWKRDWIALDACRP
jgi:hypothetical protein